MKRQGIRGLCCAALIALLAVSGYAGMRREEAQSVSIPIVFDTIMESELVFGDAQEEDSFEKEREKALSLLEDVIRDPKAKEKTVQNALEEKIRIAGSMEQEARLRQALTEMGIEDAGAISGNGTMTLILPSGSMIDDKTRIQIVDTVQTVTGILPECVKIILAKK